MLLLLVFFFFLSFHSNHLKKKWGISTRIIYSHLPLRFENLIWISSSSIYGLILKKLTLMKINIYRYLEHGNLKKIMKELVVKKLMFQNLCTQNIFSLLCSSQNYSKCVWSLTIWSETTCDINKGFIISKNIPLYAIKWIMRDGVSFSYSTNDTFNIFHNALQYLRDARYFQ